MLNLDSRAVDLRPNEKLLDMKAFRCITAWYQDNDGTTPNDRVAALYVLLRPGKFYDFMNDEIIVY